MVEKITDTVSLLKWLLHWWGILSPYQC